MFDFIIALIVIFVITYMFIFVSELLEYGLNMNNSLSLKIQYFIFND